MTKPRIVALTTLALIVLVSLFVFREERELAGDRPLEWSFEATQQEGALLPDVNQKAFTPAIRETRGRILESVIEDRNGDLLLARSKNYTIEYIPAADVFWVSVGGEPVEEARQQAETWFRDFGLAQIDLCDLPVRFLLAGFSLQAAHPDFSSLPTGCSASE